jgi:TM2 domain-containing membrane protein YozV
MIHQKDKGIAYALLIIPSIFWMAGIHRFYLGQIGMGILYLLTWGFFGIGLLIDVFALSGMVDKYNLIQKDI